jgi:hypothetical protein
MKIQPEGWRSRLIASNAAHDPARQWPAWSPDGTSIAYGTDANLRTFAGNPR